MSPILLYILNVIRQDMTAQPRAYGGNHPPLKHFLRDSNYTRHVLVTEPIPWSYP